MSVQCSDCVKMFMFKTGKLCNNCGKDFQNYALLKTHTKKVHKQEAFGCANLSSTGVVHG